MKDRTVMLAAPAALLTAALFIYPFAYGLLLSFEPLKGDWLANYAQFFSSDRLWPTIGITLKLALPATLINVGLALPIAYRMRFPSRSQKWLTTVLVVPITLGTVLIAEGMLTYFGPRGWLAQFLQLLHLYDGPIRLTHNYWGVLISLVISGFPFAFLLILSYVTGIDPVLARAAATLGVDSTRCAIRCSGSSDARRPPREEPRRADFRRSPRPTRGSGRSSPRTRRARTRSLARDTRDR